MDDGCVVAKSRGVVIFPDLHAKLCAGGEVRADMVSSSRRAFLSIVSADLDGCCQGGKKVIKSSRHSDVDIYGRSRLPHSARIERFIRY